MSSTSGPDQGPPAIPDAGAQRESSVPDGVAHLATAPPLPLDRTELDRALRRPMRLLDLTLTMPSRIGATGTDRGARHRLVSCLLLASVLFAIPFGVAYGLSSWWRIVPLYLGSTLLCLPALHVFTRYLGVPITADQTASIALCLPATAAAFTLGFAPIVAFLHATMDQDGGADGQISWLALARVLLALSLLAGAGQLWRCLLQARREDSPTLRLLLIAWHFVLGYVLLRMATLLGLD